MRCRECGLEVDNDKAFCPVCGAPMKVTADYEYIQAEIANKVDRFFNEEHPDRDEYDEEQGQERSASGQPDETGDSVETMAKTRNFYGNDSVFGDDYPSDDRDPEDDYDNDREGNGSGRRSRWNRVSQPSKRILYKKKDQTTARLITAMIIIFICAAAAVGVMAIMGVFNKNDPGSNPSTNAQVLSCSLEAGATYEAPVQVTISNPQAGNVFYTLDGTEPNFNSKIYIGPFEITADEVLSSYPSVHFRAVSFTEDSEKSGEINMEIFLEYDEAVAAKIEEMQTTTEPETEAVLTLSAPQISPVPGEYDSDQNILVSSPDGAEIFYTFDGSIPNERSTRYTGPVKMRPGVSTFSAICIKDGVSSPVSSYGYTLEYDYPYSSSDALNRVTNQLIGYGDINDYDLYTSEGYARLTHEGVYEIEGYTYYVIRVEFFGSDGALINTVYRGVGVNYGGVYALGQDDHNGYYVGERLW